MFGIDIPILILAGVLFLAGFGIKAWLTKKFQNWPLLPKVIPLANLIVGGIASLAFMLITSVAVDVQVILTCLGIGAAVAATTGGVFDIVKAGVAAWKIYKQIKGIP